MPQKVGHTPSGSPIAVRRVKGPAPTPQDSLETRLRVYKALYGCSYDDMAAALGISAQTFIKVRKGKRPMELSLANDLAYMLGISLDKLTEIAPPINRGGLGRP